MSNPRPAVLSDLLPEEQALLLRSFCSMKENETFDFDIAMSLAGKACLNIVAARADGLVVTSRGERMCRG